MDLIASYILNDIPYEANDIESKTLVKLTANAVTKVNEAVTKVNELDIKTTDIDNKKVSITDLEVSRHLSATGDFTGTLDGFPLVFDQTGLATTVSGHSGQIAGHTAQLADNMINIKQFGAHSITEIGYENFDSTQAIQAAINAGSAILIPNGTFLHTTLTLRTNTKIIGYGDSSILKNTSNASSILIPTADAIVHTVIQDVTLVGQLNNALQNGIEFTGLNSAYCIINRVKIQSFGKHGIYGGHIGHVNNVEIKGCEIANNAKCGIDLQYAVGQVNAVWIHHNNIRFNGEHGIRFYGNNVIIESNSIQANLMYGISVGEDKLLSTRSYCMGSSIIKNYFEGNYSTAVAGGSVIGLFACYEVATIDSNRFIRNLEISNNYFVETGAKYVSLLYIKDIKTLSSVSASYCSIRTSGNHADTQLLTFNRASALSYGCVIDENSNSVLPQTLIDILPTYVDLRGNGNRKLSSTVETPIAVTLLNGWVNGTGVSPLKYFKDGFGIVHIFGTCTGGAVGSVIGVLPVGYRPILMTNFAGNSNGAFALCVVSYDGSIRVDVGSPLNVNFNGITFRGEQ